MIICIDCYQIQQEDQFYEYRKCTFDEEDLCFKFEVAVLATILKKHPLCKT